mgnify:CR=1 FL=1
MFKINCEKGCQTPELDAKIDDKHNEIAALMQEWEEKMAMLE